MQGFGLFTMEELQWGDSEHPWIRPGQLFTRGPGFYKIPAFNDVPIDFRITLLRDAANPTAVHSSKAVGEPPIFLASAALFAARNAVTAARADAGLPFAADFVQMDSPATSEKLRMLCLDQLTERFTAGNSPTFRPRGSW